MKVPGFFSASDAYVKVALAGISIYLTAAVIVLVAILILSPADAVFGVILLVPAAIAVAALRFIRRWGLLIAALLAAFGFVAFLADAGLFLTTPESFFDFMLTLFTLVGLGIAVIACLVGFVQYFRGAVGTQVSTAIVTGLRGVTAVIIVAAGISLVLTVINATDSVSATDKQGAIELVAEDNEWNVETLEAAAGQPIRILLKNDDPFRIPRVLPRRRGSRSP